MLASDCGMKYLPRDTAYRTLRAMTFGAADAGPQALSSHVVAQYT